jgi:hypothetical protein
MAQISSTFQIVTDYASGQPTINLATSRGMRVVSIQGTGADNAVITVSKVASGGGLTAMGTVTMQDAAGGGVDSLVDQYGVMQSVADSTLVATDTIRLVCSAANSTRCVLNCMAETGATVVES